MFVHNSEHNSPVNSDHDDDIHDFVTRISKQDISDPLHLHPNNTTALTVVSIKLKGTEIYQVWSCAMLLTLEGKNKIGFIDGSYKRSNTDEVFGKQWDRVNAIVLGWILNSISEELFLDLGDAYRLFDEMPERNSVSWSVMVGGFGKAGDYMKCFEIFREYVRSGQRLDVYTLPAVIRICRDKMDVKMGRVIHDIVLRYGLCWNTFICVAIVDMYAKCGVIDDARMMFDGMDEKYLTTWTVMIGAYAACGSANESLVLFDQMQECGIVPDKI
ncbi:pentatricopeptide repeat-containing protein [Tanacetum coccineum]